VRVREVARLRLFGRTAFALVEDYYSDELHAGGYETEEIYKAMDEAT
jgi:hypothetical protein